MIHQRKTQNYQQLYDKFALWKKQRGYIIERFVIDV